jgi:hypothetical protein
MTVRALRRSNNAQPVHARFLCVHAEIASQAIGLESLRCLIARDTAQYSFLLTGDLH